MGVVQPSCSHQHRISDTGRVLQHKLCQLGAAEGEAQRTVPFCWNLGWLIAIWPVQVGIHHPPMPSCTQSRRITGCTAQYQYQYQDSA